MKFKLIMFKNRIYIVLLILLLVKYIYYWLFNLLNINLQNLLIISAIIVLLVFVALKYEWFYNPISEVLTLCIAPKNHFNVHMRSGYIQFMGKNSGTIATAYAKSLETLILSLETGTVPTDVHIPQYQKNLEKCIKVLGEYNNIIFTMNTHNTIMEMILRLIRIVGKVKIPREEFLEDAMNDSFTNDGFLIICNSLEIKISTVKKRDQLILEPSYYMKLTDIVKAKDLEERFKYGFKCHIAITISKVS